MGPVTRAGFCAVLFPLLALGPSDMQGASPVRAAPALASIAYRVHRMPAMMAFYSEVLGARFHEVDTGGLRSQFADVGGLTLKFVPIRDGVDFDGFPVHQPGFIVPDIAAAIAAAERHGGRVQNPPEQRDGRMHAAVRDPDGNTIEISSAQLAVGPGPAFTTRGAFFALSVPDVDASARWYADTLGLKVVLSPPKQEQSRMIALEGGGLLVELLQRDDAMPLERAAAGVKQNDRVHGFFKAGIVVDDFDKTLATLKARGVEIAIGPFPARADQRANVLIKDNAGNLIQLFGTYR